MSNKLKNLVVVGSVLLAAFGVSAALSEANLRTALGSWMKGDAVILNPWTEGLNYFTDSRLATNFGWDPGSLASNQTLTTSVAYTGVNAGDMVLAAHENVGNQPALHITGRASNNIVYVSLFNNSGAAIDVATGLVRVLVLKY